MTLRRFISLAAVLVAAGLVLAQPPASKEPTKKDTPAKKESAKRVAGSLEDTLEKALRNSADIKAAEAKVRDAEAELNKVRHQVLARATALHSDLNLAKRMLALSEETYALLVSMEAAKIPREKLQEAEAARVKHHGEVEKLNAELKSLRGEFAIKNIGKVAFSPDGGTILFGATTEGKVRIWDAADGALIDMQPFVEPLPFRAAKLTTVQAPMAERIRKFLGTEVSFEELLKTHKGDFTLAALIDSLLKVTKSDVPIHKVQPTEDQRWNVDLQVKGTMPVAAVLQSIEDHSHEIRIVVREYGLLITSKDRVPEGAMGVVDFWKAKETKPKEEKQSPR